MSITLYEIRSDIESIASNSDLCEETNPIRRKEAVDHIEFHIVERIEGLLETVQPHELTELKEYAESVKSRLRENDHGLLSRLRAGIRSGAKAASYFLGGSPVRGEAPEPQVRLWFSDGDYTGRGLTMKSGDKRMHG